MKINSRANFRAHLNRVPNEPTPFRLLTIFLAFLAALSLSGCVGLTGAGTPAATTNSAASGTLAASATSFSFGNVTVGSNSSQTLTLTNSGTAAVAISQATVTGAAFSIAGGASAVSIPAGQSYAFQILFAPQTAGNATGSISVSSNATNSSLSVSLTGTGMTALAITAQPASQSVTSGQTASFTLGATGTGTLTYQWKKNGAAISGATSASYTTPATAISDNGAQFTVVVTDSTGSVTSNAAILTVTAAPVAPTISQQPASQTVTAGQTATFSVTATGTATLTYQWKKNGAAISGATSASYTTPATAASDSGAQFTVTITNSVGNVTSNTATLTVNVPPSITAQPVSQTVTAGQNATFSVTATGSGTLTYQWKKNGTAISGATSASYTTPATGASDNGALFTVTITNSVGNVTSNAATLRVNVPPSITAQPANKTVVAGQTATFSVTAAGTATLTYQWNRNGSAISGATSASYTTPATTASDNGAQFSVTVTNGSGSMTSNAATLTVTPATFILNTSTTNLSFSSVNTGSSSVLSVTFTNAGNSNVNISNVSISGAGFTASGISSGQIVSPGQTATLNVTFAPSATGSVTGSATVASNAAPSPATISLSGTGVTPVAHSVTLSWTASTSTVSGYNIYRAGVSGGPYTKLNSSLDASTTYVDSTVQSGQTYFYVATSVDSTGDESAYSSEVSATIP